MFGFNQDAATRPCSHLMNIVRDTRAHHPNFVLFLGAGASASSGVPTAGRLIREWREKFVQTYPNQQLESQPFYNQADEYSKLFEILYDQQSQRREFIESKIGDATPSWGYIYLVNLIRNRVFNTVFTTNFDDLLNEACYQFSSDLRPIVCAHDSSIRFVRITSKRPKIVKLHGDFLFDNIKNTVRELETLEENMKNKFRQFASEFGFVFLGYSGNDRSVMDVVNTLVRSDGFFPHGIYWCVKQGEPISASLRELAKNPKVCLIETKGFDEFCVELHTRLGLALQDEVRDPYGCLTAKLNTLLDRAKVSDGEHNHPTIQSDVQRLAERLSAPGKTEKQGDRANVPLLLLAQAAQQKGDHTQAYQYAFSELKRSSSLRALELCFNSAIKLKDEKLLQELTQHLDENIAILTKSPGVIHNFVVELLSAQLFSIAENLLLVGGKHFNPSTEFCEEYNWSYHLINLGQCLRHQGKELPSELKEQLTEVASGHPSPFSRFGAYLVLGDEPNAISQVREFASHGGHSLESVLQWPIADLFSEQSKGALLQEYQKAVRTMRR